MSTAAEIRAALSRATPKKDTRSLIEVLREDPALRAKFVEAMTQIEFEYWLVKQDPDFETRFKEL